MIRVDDLEIKGLKILQDDSMFSFGIDAVLLSDFVKANKNAKILDIGMGIGIIPILIYGKDKSNDIVGIEIQEDVCNLAKKSVELNGLTEYINCVCEDIRNYKVDILYDVIVTNPPYMTKDTKKAKDERIATARSEIKLNLEELFKAIKSLLKENGKLYMIHRPNRLVDIFYYARKNKIEPKSIRFVKPFEDRESNLVLLEFVKGGKPFLKVEKDLIVYEKNGEYTDEILRIYGKK